MKSNVVAIGKPYLPTSERNARPITLDEFSAADEAREWEQRIVVNGMTILHYPRATLICCQGSHCTAMYQTGANIEGYFDKLLEALDKVA